MPGAAMPGLPDEQSNGAPEALQMSVPAPFRTVTPPYFEANACSAAVRSA